MMAMAKLPGPAAVSAAISPAMPSAIKAAALASKASSQTAITFEEAYFVFGFGMAGMIEPWSDETAMFIRTVTKSTLLAWAANIGVGGASPFASRKLDTFGVGYYYVGVSESLKNFAPRLVPLGDEQGVEAFYNVGVTPWFHVTPDFQVILPWRERVDTTLVFGLRAKVDF